MTRPARAVVNAQALRANLARVRGFAPNAKVMAIVKANAYGHGLAWAARTLMATDAFGVASAEEGIELRNAGIAHPVCLLEGCFEAREWALAAQHRLSPVVHCDTQLEYLERHYRGAPLTVWLKLDTGMHRLGFAPARFKEVAARLRACSGASGVRAMSHFAAADDIADPATPKQLAQFTQAVPTGAFECSLANSAGIVAWPASHRDWVRPGIMLYGASPTLSESAETVGLQPVMTLESALISVQRVRKGEAVGYGGDWRCPEDMPVGVVAIGYGDGYSRHLRTGTPVLLSGGRAPLVGRVSMDMITIDLRAHPQAQVGDKVVLWGEGLPVEEIARHADTIAYTLLCGVTPRIPRIEIDGRKP